MCIFFEKPLKDFPLYSPILLTHCLRYLQKHIMESFTYLSCQLFFKTPHETLMFQQKLLPLQTKKNLSKHNRMEVLSIDTHLKNVYQKCTSYAFQSERVSEMDFLATWSPEFQNIFLHCPPWGYLMETVN